MADHRTKLAEGKTKILYAVPGQDGEVTVLEKDDMTAGNGARHEVVPLKGKYANTASCAMFSLLRNNDVPTAHIRQIGHGMRVMHKSAMLPYEVVVRFEADGKGSLVKTNPDVKPGQRFDPPLVQFYLKTTDREFRRRKLPWDDPLLIERSHHGIRVADPARPLKDAETAWIPHDEIYGANLPMHDFDTMEDIAREAGGIVLHAWAELRCRLVDFKIEFDDQYRISDSLGPDEWRLYDDQGNPLSKQPFRNGASIDEMTSIYTKVAQLCYTIWRRSNSQKWQRGENHIE